MQHNVLDASLLAKLTFRFGGAVLVDHKDIGLQSVDSADEVHHAVAVVDEGIFHVTDGFHHEEALLFGIERLMVFVVQNGLIGADAHIEVAILRRLTEELDVAAVEEVVTTAYKDFGCWLLAIGCWLRVSHHLNLDIKVLICLSSD